MVPYFIVLILLLISRVLECRTIGDIDSKEIWVEENVLDSILEVNKGSTKDLLEGDIFFKDDDPHKELHYMHGKQKRNARRDRNYLWHNKIVPYEIIPDLEFHRPLIEEALKTISNQSCITFKNHTTEKDWIKFVKRDGCWSSVGRTYWISGSQEVSLAAGCHKKGIIVHEVLHALGFWHEQSRPDRNKYVEIFWENIIPGNENNFERHSHKVIDIQRINYDYSSIMHYGRRAFSKNGENTIVPIRNINATIGRRDALSPKDVLELNLLYDCRSNVRNFWSIWSEFGPCDDHCNRSRQRFCTHHDSSKCPHADRFGVEEEKVKCPHAECYAPIDGHWGRWSSWTKCSATCNWGTKTRHRECTNPMPKHGGKNCFGDKVSSGPCEEKSCYLGPNDCEFSFDFCGLWVDKSTSTYKWIRHKGKTPSSRTGPEGDHTNQKGFYIYTEASFVPKKATAVLETEHEYDVTNGRCLSFWYHMYGAGIGDLFVYLRERNQSGYVQRTLTSLQGEQGKEWKHMEVTYNSAYEHKIVFEARMGTSFLADIALDDVYIKNGTCDSNKHTTATPTTTLASPTTTLALPTTTLATQTKTLASPTTTLATQTTTLATPTTTLATPTTTLATPTTKKKVNFQQIGCFNDNHTSPHPFPHHVDMRLFIEWKNISKIVVRCANHVRSLGYTYFGIQFYGECWYGPTQQVKYDVDGHSDNCWLQKVGREQSLMVYKII